MGELFRRQAAAINLELAWVAFTAGRLAAEPDVVERLAAEPIPTDEASAQRLGEAHGIDGWLLWLAVRGSCE